MTETRRYEIRVQVRTAYMDAQSDPDHDRYVFAYTVTITNEGSIPAQLLDRHWVITDSNGRIQEVRGEGVVGKRPHLKPGEDFRYTSGTMLETAVGTMRGSYHMVAADGTEFDVDIPPFTLSIPRTLH